MKNKFNFIFMSFFVCFLILSCNKNELRGGIYLPINSELHVKELEPIIIYGNHIYNNEWYKIKDLDTLFNNKYHCIILVNDELHYFDKEFKKETVKKYQLIKELSKDIDINKYRELHYSYRFFSSHVPKSSNLDIDLELGLGKTRFVEYVYNIESERKFSLYRDTLFFEYLEEDSILKRQLLEIMTLVNFPNEINYLGTYFKGTPGYSYYLMNGNYEVATGVIDLDGFETMTRHPIGPVINWVKYYYKTNVISDSSMYKRTHNFEYLPKSRNLF